MAKLILLGISNAMNFQIKLTWVIHMWLCKRDELQANQRN
jgi:hypothetical protein